MICALRLHAPAGIFVGTGWFVGPKTLITAGHCVYDRNQMGGWAKEIEVSPGQDDGHTPFGTVTAKRFSTLDTWFNGQDPDFDIGAIHLDQPLGEDVGWFAVGSVPASEVSGYGVNVSGYPADRGAGRQQWFHINRILHVGDRRLRRGHLRGRAGHRRSSTRAKE
jgi:V8-like Glu-specific endopeptidase